jgi:hypothetical protein
VSEAFQHDLAVCQRHAHYLARADTRLPAQLTAGHLARGEDDLIAALDQFVLRFMRLQDTMGARLLRGVLVAVLKEPFEDRPLRDVLDRLERFGVIPSADRWDEIRSMRNQLATTTRRARPRRRRPSSWRGGWPKRWPQCWTGSHISSRRLARSRDPSPGCSAAKSRTELKDRKSNRIKETPRPYSGEWLRVARPREARASRGGSPRRSLGTRADLLLEKQRVLFRLAHDRRYISPR